MGWGTNREVTSLAAVSQPIVRSHVGAIIFWLTALALVAAVAAVTEFVVTRYVSATRRVAQLMTATAIYLRTIVYKISSILPTSSKILTIRYSDLSCERGGTGPAPPRDLVGGMPPEPVVVGYMSRRGEHYAGLVVAAGAAAIFI